MTINYSAIAMLANVVIIYLFKIYMEMDIVSNLMNALNARMRHILNEFDLTKENYYSTITITVFYDVDDN